MSLTVAFLGNFGVPYSSESHEAASYEALGHTVVRIQEGETRATDVARIVKDSGAELFHWVQTYGLAVSGGSIHERYEMLEDIKSMGVPTIAYHLDLWHGLDREHQLKDEPYFRCDFFFSTDGGPRDWTALGINHHWLPPAVYHEEAHDVSPNPRRWQGKIAFVGSWKHYGHEEHWPVRKAMLDVLRRRFRRHFVTYPTREAVRGHDLNELYATIPVIVGDSCLAGKIPGYWSDRIPETTGRGGFLIHPYVPGVLNSHPDLVTYEAEDWTALCDRVEHYLNSPVARESNRVHNAAWTRQHHCYTNRMQTVIDTALRKVSETSIVTRDASQVS